MSGKKKSRQKQKKGTMKGRISMIFAAITFGLLLVGMLINLVVSGDSILLVIIIPLVFGGCSLFIFKTLLNNYLSPLDDLVEIMHRVNDEQNLTVQAEIDGFSELEDLADSYNKTVATLQGLVAKGIEVVKGSDTRMEDIMNAISEITSGVQESTGSVNEFSLSAQELDQNTQDMLDASNTTAEEIRTGREGVLNSTRQISEATEQITRVDPYVERLNQHSANIGRVVGIITEIAEETKLLAFNASIEAARAGEHGQGFAVVADEVRNLADQSAKAAKEISEMIGGVQEEVKQTEEVLKDSVENIRHSASEVEKIEAIFDKISGFITDMSGRVSSIANLAKEISSGSEDLAAVMEEQTASIEEMSSNIEIVHENIKEMTSEIQIFNP